MADKKVHYKKVAASEDFRKLLEEKRRFIVPMTIFFFLLLFTSGCYILLHLFEHAGNWRDLMGLVIRPHTICHDLGFMWTLCKKSS